MGILSTPIASSENDLDYHLPQIYRSILKKFKTIAQSFIRFHALFLTLIISEMGALTAAIAYFPNKTAIALVLSSLFFTCFSYLILLFYYQTRKGERCADLKTQLIEACMHHIPQTERGSVNHLPIANALLNLANYLDHFDFHEKRGPLLSKWLKACYKTDIFKMKLLLLHAAIEEHLKQIRLTPTDLEVHASLANLYIILSRLYQSHQIEKLFQTTAKLAVEEFRILSHYAPHDPWVHEQLASGFSQLEMAQEELQELETLIQLKPKDLNTLYRLGALYFDQGLNAQGLQIYEQLRKQSFPQAEELIAAYTAPPK